MSVAARVAREMGVKLGNEVRSVGTEGRGEPQGSGIQPHCPQGPTPQAGHWPLVPSPALSGSTSPLCVTDDALDRLATASALRTAPQSEPSSAT